MNFLTKRQGRERLWAGLETDYEMVINDFMKQSGVSFEDFAKVAKKSQITLLYHVSVGQAKSTLEYHKEVGNIVLNTAKDFWLHPGTAPITDLGDPNKKPPSPSKVLVKSEGSLSCAGTGTQDLSEYSEDNSMPSLLQSTFIGPEDKQDIMDLGLKYRLGGFYLTYLMYFRQPYLNFLKIKMDPKDDDSYLKFTDLLTTVSREHAEEVEFMMARLRINHAFEITGFADWYNANAATRNFLNCKKNKVLDFAKTDRQTQNSITYGQIIPEAQNNFHGYLVEKKRFSEKGRFNTIPPKKNRLDLETRGSTSASAMKEMALDDTFGKNDCPELCQFPWAEPIENGIDMHGTGAIVQQEAATSSSFSEDTKGVVHFPHAMPDTAMVNTDMVKAMKAVNGTGEICEASTSLQAMADHPRQTPGALLGNSLIDRFLNKEANRRLSRMLAKEKQKANRDPEAAKPKNPYKKEGGLFGHDEVERKNHPRFKASFSLWKYIRGHGYQDDDPASYKYGASANGENGDGNAEAEPNGGGNAEPNDDGNAEAEPNDDGNAEANGDGNAEPDGDDNEDPNDDDNAMPMP